jgi:UDP-2,3-diacylglucosamine pyrophosphatase LpxH
VEAVAKLQRMMDRADADCPHGERFFCALRAFLSNGHKLTLLLGNHDVELSLPPVRRALLEQLSQGSSPRFEFLFDGEAYQYQNLIIEHGNRYDGWNAVSHGLLRAFRACLSRGETPKFIFPPPPGSRLVAELMNPLKRYMPFIDLLKPETEAMIPILVAIDPNTLRSLRNIISFNEKWVEATQLHPSPGQQPMLADTISRHPATSLREEIETMKRVAACNDYIGESMERARQILRATAQEWEDADANNLARPIGQKLTDAKGILYFISQSLPIPGFVIERLDRTLQAFQKKIEASFDLQSEEPEYLEAARRLAANGRIVVFGHTHLAKRIRLNENSLYLNTGTWCPLIQLPSDALQNDLPPQQRRQQLRAFVEALQGHVTEVRPRLYTTLVKAVVSESRTEAEVYQWTDKDTLEVFEGYAPRP